MFRKPLSTRWSLVALVGIPVLWFAIWLLLGWLVQVAGVKIASGADITALLAIIGGIMGAIFTIGGLVIALVAVLTQIQLQDRVTQMLSQTRQALEDRFNNELVQKYEQSTQDQVEGTLAFFQATLARDWKEAERLTRQALEKYRKLLGTRSFLGLRMSTEVEAYFTNQFFRSPYRMWPLITAVSYAANSYVSTGEDVVGGIASPSPLYPVPSPYYPVQAPLTNVIPTSDPPTQEAIEWLTDALEHNDNPEGRVATALALMYGVNESYEKMLQAVRHAIASYPASKQDFLTRVHVAMLIYACRNEQSRIARVGDLIDYPMPVPVEDIRKSVEELDPKMLNKRVDWYAEEIGPRPTSLYPALVQIFRPDEEDGRITASAIVFPHDGMQYSVPEPVGDPQSRSQPKVSIEELVSQLSTRLCFLYPARG